MMTEEQQLQLQAWVDGELGPRERRRVDDWIAQDQKARALADELRTVQQCVAGGELPRRVPETRDFYWSKIRRAIEQDLAADEAVRRERGGRPWWRWWVPAAAALLVLGALAILRHLPDGDSRAVLAVVNEVETPLREVSSFSFRAESERMTVVWVNFKSE